MSNSLSSYEAVLQLTNTLPINIIDEGKSLIQFASVPISIKTHINDPVTEEYRIEYTDMEISRTLSFPTGGYSGIQNGVMMHRHNYYEMMIVRSGEITVKFEGLEYRYHSGDVSIVNREIIHGEIGNSGYEAVYISILPEYLKAWPAEGIFTNANRVGPVSAEFFRKDLNEAMERKRSYLNFICLENLRGREELFAELNAMKEEMSGRRKGADLMVCGRMVQLFSILSNPAFYKTRKIDLGAAREKDVVEYTRRYLDARTCGVSLDELASALHYSPDYISRIFAKHLHKTPLQYNREVRLKEARRLLLETDLSVVEISQKVGYENRTHFYNIFKQSYGLTPAAYRESAASHENQDNVLRRAAQQSCIETGPNPPSL